MSWRHNHDSYRYFPLCQFVVFRAMRRCSKFSTAVSLSLVNTRIHDDEQNLMQVLHVRQPVTRQALANHVLCYN
jgi:hypothetical protein